MRMFLFVFIVVALIFLVRSEQQFQQEQQFRQEQIQRDREALGIRCRRDRLQEQREFDRRTNDARIRLQLCELMSVGQGGR